MARVAMAPAGVEPVAAEREVEAPAARAEAVRAAVEREEAFLAALVVAEAARVAVPVVAALQVAAVACSMTTLLMAVGTTGAITTSVKVGDYAGLGRVMPWTFAGFAVGAASLIGMPPFAGAWAKLWLIAAASGARLDWAAALAGVAAVLTFVHLGPLAANALAGRAPTDAFKRPDGASILLAAPVILSGLATLWLLVLADPLYSFLSPIWSPQ